MNLKNIQTRTFKVGDATPTFFQVSDTWYIEPQALADGLGIQRPSVMALRRSLGDALNEDLISDIKVPGRGRRTFLMNREAVNAILNHSGVKRSRRNTFQALLNAAFDRVQNTSPGSDEVVEEVDLFQGEGGFEEEPPAPPESEPEPEFEPDTVEPDAEPTPVAPEYVMTPEEQVYIITKLVDMLPQLTESAQLKVLDYLLI